MGRRVAICGCCVSRDTIAFAENKNIQAGCFIHFNSPLSLACENILNNLDITQEDLINCTPFLGRVFYADWMKNSFKLLTDAHAEWCVIDMGHIRYDLLEIIRKSDGCKTYITYSREATENIEKVLMPALGEAFSAKKKSAIELSDNELNDFFGRFCEKLLRIFAPDKIILQEIYLCEFWKDSNGYVNAFDQNFLHINAFMTKCHKIIKRIIPQCKIIPFPKFVLCDQNHIWGGIAFIMNTCITSMHMNVWKR